MSDVAHVTPLFQRLLGPQFDALPGPVRRLHAASLPQRFEGRATVRSVHGRVARMLASTLGLPVAGSESPIAVRIEASGAGECWTREFPGRRMRSRLWTQNGLLFERFGPVLLRFRLHGDARGIEWEPIAANVCGAPVPAQALRSVLAREWVEDGRYRFMAEGGLPWLGVVTAYRGWLAVD